jgi:hypothetical protein
MVKIGSQLQIKSIHLTLLSLHRHLQIFLLPTSISNTSNRHHNDTIDELKNIAQLKACTSAYFKVPQDYFRQAFYYAVKMPMIMLNFTYDWEKRTD